MRLHLTNPQIEHFIDEKVKAGHFPNREAVVADAISRMMEEDEPLTAEDAAAISESDREIDGGQSVDFKDFAQQMRKRYGVSGD